MPRVFNQKIKILYLMRIFLEQTDEEHPMSVKELIAYLNSLGISAERKTVYDDIETLRNFGMDILNRREHPAGFYLASREFELPELRLLVDAVQSSRCITNGKSRQLIRKLESLASVYESRQLRRQGFAENRIRTINENVYYSIDMIQRALTEDRQISFQYCEWTVEKKLRPENEGERYSVSPWGLVWQNEEYYLITYDEKCGRVKQYQVDKLQQIRSVGTVYLQADYRSTWQDTFYRASEHYFCIVGRNKTGIYDLSFKLQDCCIFSVFCGRLSVEE